MACHPGATATEPYPSDEERGTLALTHAALVESGIGSSTKPLDLSVLAAAVYARGWSYAIDRSGSDYRATIRQANPGLGRFQTVGLGQNMETALAFSLEKALAVAPPDNRPS